MYMATCSAPNLAKSRAILLLLNTKIIEKKNNYIFRRKIKKFFNFLQLDHFVGMHVQPTETESRDKNGVRFDERV
jgi:hypothetical protein